MRAWLYLLLGVLLGLSGGGPVRGQQGTLCGVCEEYSTGKMYIMTDRLRGVKVMLCERCTRLRKTCTSCEVPIFKDFTSLPDGRFLCRRDAQLAVLDQDTAIRIYAEVKRDLFALMNGLGVLPDRNISVSLVDQKHLMRVFAGTPGAHPDSSLQGVTRTRRYSKEGLEHEIFLCLGLPRNRFAAVAAHEYAHTWVHENVPSDRVLDRDTVEAFCELAAYEIMRQRGEAMEMEAIVNNTYTRGKIDVFLKASADYQFHRVAQWMKSGLDDSLEKDRTQQVTRLKPSGLPTFGYLPVVHARAPEVLVLKGLSGRAPKQYALINDTTLQVGEAAKVRVADTNVLVRCLEIREQSVLVRVNQATEPVELRLRDPEQP